MKKSYYLILPFLKERHVPLHPCHCGHFVCHGLYIKTRVGQTQCLYGMQADKTSDNHPMLPEICIP